MSSTTDAQLATHPRSARRASGITLETYILEGMMGVPGGDGRVHLAPQPDRPRREAHHVEGAARRPRQHPRLHGRDQRAGRAGAEARRDRQRDADRGRSRRRGHCAAIASEELERDRGPLDRSAREIRRRLRPARRLVEHRRQHLDRHDLRHPEAERHVETSRPRRTSSQPGRELLAAGYVLYGSSTMLVLTTGARAASTASPTIRRVGEFFLSHENIRIPERGKIYSINEGNTRASGATRCGAGTRGSKEEDKADGRPYGARYVGTLVADAHRTLLKGGIFAYPADKQEPGRQAPPPLRSEPVRVHLRGGRRQGLDRERAHPRHRADHAPPARPARPRLGARRRRVREPS